MAVIGIVVGIVGAWGGSRLLSGFLFGVESTDLGTYAMVSGVMAVVAFLASYLPALRATRIDPVVALRTE